MAISQLQSDSFGEKRGSRLHYFWLLKGKFNFQYSTKWALSKIYTTISSRKTLNALRA